MTERLYYSDSFLRNFSSCVTDIRELSRSDGQSVWQVALESTAFYPTSGGQPHDLGVLTAISRSGAVLEVPVTAVEEDENGEVWHQTLKPLLAGTEVKGEIDWQRRLDHMQQHSGQHLLSAIFVQQLQAPTVSFHLGETSSTIDLAVNSLAQHSLERVERIANELIAEDRAVTARKIDRSEAEVLLATGALRKLPERDGEIRLIEIANCDLNACGGTHVRSTGQIGGLLVRGVERVRQGVRVEFTCGLRAVAAARQDFSVLRRSASFLSAPRSEVPAGIERLVADAKASAKELHKLREEAATYHAVKLAVEEQIVDHLRLVRRVFTDRDTDYVKLLASRLVASVPQTVALLVSEQQGLAFVVLARSGDMEFHAGNLMKEALAARGLRGGGSPDLAQGQVPAEQSGSLLDALEAAVHKAAARTSEMA
ncbi:alanyl-tRNA editing protein [Alloacidobacterium sp.]|uniref:alanyl-tRNA editing protein n=1 Tax=Alloacidobacterium sp. TaxID=2951999 RepID=UPI002D5F407E|nr:DHHA1 domain-containing protein [Alloacidobacterium sp.]HYK35577.1 DHHA1 domain-containing protein [Alloacidobacterium sp.]